VLTLLNARGEIDSGGLDDVLVRYRRFFQFIRAVPQGHVSVAFEPDADVQTLAGQINAILDRAEARK
jgi:hypothetical protein